MKSLWPAGKAPFWSYPRDWQAQKVLLPFNVGVLYVVSKVQASSAMGWERANDGTIMQSEAEGPEWWTVFLVDAELIRSEASPQLKSTECLFVVSKSCVVHSKSSEVLALLPRTVGAASLEVSKAIDVPGQPELQGSSQPMQGVRAEGTSRSNLGCPMILCWQSFICRA